MFSDQQFENAMYSGMLPSWAKDPSVNELDYLHRQPGGLTFHSPRDRNKKYKATATQVRLFAIT